MRRRKKKISKIRLLGMVVYVPFLLLPFCALFFETWMCTEKLRHGYAMSRANGELRQIQERIDALRDDVANLKRIERIDAKAPDLALIEPLPEQIRPVYVAVESAPLSGEVDIAMSDSHEGRRNR